MSSLIGKCYYHGSYVQNEWFLVAKFKSSLKRFMVDTMTRLTVTEYLFHK